MSLGRRVEAFLGRYDGPPKELLATLAKVFSHEIQRALFHFKSLLAGRLLILRFYRRLRRLASLVFNAFLFFGSHRRHWSTLSNFVLFHYCVF